MAILEIRNSGLYKFGQVSLEFDENGKEIVWTFEEYLKREFQITKIHGYRLINAVDFVRKIQASKVTKNTRIGYSDPLVLPANEGQIRPLNDLQHDGERMHVWDEVVKSGEKKITAELVQREVDKFKASGVVVPDVEIQLPEVTDKDLLSDTELALLALLGGKPNLLLFL